MTFARVGKWIVDEKIWANDDNARLTLMAPGVGFEPTRPREVTGWL